MDPVEIFRNNHRADVSAARDEAMVAIAKTFPKWTHFQIAKFFDRDTSTIQRSLTRSKKTREKATT